MGEPTVNRSSGREWDAYFGPTRAKPTADRGRGALISCSRCGGLRLNYDGLHATHFSGGMLVDCAGHQVEQ